MHSISNALERLRTQLAQALPATPGLRHVDVSFPLNDAFDPLAWLGAQCLFPQFYWQQRNVMKSWLRWAPSSIFPLWLRLRSFYSNSL
ncbi:menaquinone-specific isochorismate synthase [Enterobacter cloacae]|uniref:Menaquinone-specific isochorismate synthase n=1 Tax=Enterobacter cloacae TaxID=550 RepID=A0A377LW48_ENTCL|nr:menaquinone-specific isochorismate synthase [Enterobacter cloacae]